MPLTPQQIAEIKRRALARGISEQEVDLAMPQLVRDFESKMQGSGSINTSGVTVQSPQSPEMPPLPQDATNQGNFLTNTAKALVKPAVDYAKFVGESVAQASRAGADAISGNQGIFGSDEISKEVGQLALQDRQIRSQMKAEKDPEKKKALAQKSRDINAKIEELGNQAREIGSKQTSFLVDENKIKDRGKIALTGAKATAGAASYAVPGSLGAGTTVAGTIARAAGAGAVAGGLQGFGSSEKGQELDNTITGAAVGGATAGALSAAGQAIKAVRQSRIQSEMGRKIAAAGTEFKKSSYVKATGRKPILREGGDKLLDKMMKAGIKPGSPDEIIYQADDILMDNAGVIFDKADEFRQKGVTVDKKKILQPLEQKLATAPAKSKPIIEKVLQNVRDDISRFDEITPVELYAMKGDYGAFGNWTSQMDSDAVTEAKLWEEIYVNLSNLMDDSFKQGGYDEFRVVNELVSTAIDAKKYAARAGNVAPNANTLGLMDVISGGIGAGTLGVPGMVLGVAAKRAMNAPVTSSVIGNTLEQLGQNIGKTTGQQAADTAVGQIARDATGRLAQRIAIDASTGSTESIQNLNNEPNNSNGQNNFNTFQNEFYQGNAPFTDIQDIVPQPTSQHPIPKFRQFANKDEMVAAAFADGLGTKDVQELVKLWDEFAPQSTSVIPPEVTTLLEQRSMLSKAGVSTKSIDAKLARYGYEPVQSSSMNSTTENRVQLATSGLRALDSIEAMIAEDPNKIFKNIIPGKLGARDYDAAAFKAVEGLLRARSGAAIPETEVRRYMDANLPRFGDSPEEIRFKLDSFRKDLEDVALSSGSFDAQAALGM